MILSNNAITDRDERDGMYLMQSITLAILRHLVHQNSGAAHENFESNRAVY